MRRSHFEALRPVCPVCRKGAGADYPLKLVHIVREESGHILEGAVHCSNANCLREYPIIDGIPLLVPNIRQYVSDNILPIYARRDLSDFTESLLGDCCGPNSALDFSRQHLSSYVWDHYADLDIEHPNKDQKPGSVLQNLAEALQLAGVAPSGPVIDAGCSAGRTSFELAARTQRLVLGVDLHFPMLRLAAEVLRHGVVRYPHRLAGLVYERREFPVQLASPGHVDFWACDATALPFPPDTFALASALNLLDCVAEPRVLLESLSAALKPCGKLVITCPYDWSPAATPVEAWVGGHSQRSAMKGSPELVLRSLLQENEHPSAVSGLKLIGERERLPWQVRLHDRSMMRYDVHLVAAERTD